MARKIVKYQVDEKKYSDTSEIFDSLFGKALRILFRRENLEEEAEKYEKKERLKRKKKKRKLVRKEEAPKGAKAEAEEKPKGAKQRHLPKGVTSVTEEIPDGTKKQRPKLSTPEKKKIVREVRWQQTQKVFLLGTKKI